MEKTVGINETKNKEKRQKIKGDPNNDIDSSEFQKKEQEINQRKDLSEVQDAADDEILKKNVSTAFEQKELDNQSVFQTQDDTGVDSKLPKDIELDSENDEKNDRKNAKKSVMDKKAVQDELQKKDTDSQKATSKVSKQEEQEVTPKAPEQKNEEKNQETTPEIPMQKTTEKQQGTNPEILKHKAEEETLDQEASKTGMALKEDIESKSKIKKEEEIPKDASADPSQVGIQLGHSNYFATVKEVAYTDTPTEGTQTQAPSQENLQKESMVASKSQSSQAIKGIFSPVEDDQQAFLDLLKATVEIWMSMWRNKRNNTDRYVQWKDIYSRLTLQNELPKVNEMMLVNENEPNALGWRLAQAFIECSVLQEYIVFFAQIVQIYDEALFEDKHLYKIVDMKLCSIFKNEVHVEAIENFIYCMHHMIERVEVEEKSIKTLADPDAQDVMRMLKLLLNIPLKESGREKTNIYQTKTYLFYQLMASLAEFKKNGSSYESVQNAWKSAKINSIRAPETSSVIKRLRTCFFEQLNHCIRKQSWDPKTMISCVTSLLEPFHGCFAPLHLFLIQNLLEKVFVYKEKKHPTLQTDYYALILKEFPNLCAKYGPLGIERFEISNVGGYRFVLNGVEIELDQLIPKQVNSKMAAAVEESSRSLEKNGYVDYTFHQSSVDCKIAQFYYEKQFGLPPWTDQGVAQLKIKGLSIELKVQVVAEEGKSSVIKIVQCKCNIKRLGIVVEKSMNPKFINQVVLSYFNPHAKANIEKQVSKFAYVFFKEIFQIKTF